MATEDANGRMPTLQELKETHMILENDLKVLSDSYSQLQLVQDKFIQNIATISSFKSAQSGSEMMLPLTSSVYIRGNLKDNERVLVDIGTGYFVEKDTKGADEYYTRKVKFIQEQLNMLAKVLQEKQKQYMMITQVLQQSTAAAK